MSTHTLLDRDLQTVQITEDTWVFRSRTWDRLKFEVEYARQQGTTANSYLIRGERTALIDPPGESFTAIYLAGIRSCIAPENLDYIILGHVNANRAATLTALLALAPRATLLCARAAVNFLKDAFPGRAIRGVRPEETLDLGRGHVLDFITAPTPRWPDGLCCYDRHTRVLFTDKFFSVHACGDAVWDENWKELDDDRRYYFDCLHAAQSKQVESVLDKFKEFPARYYAPGHGPVVRYNLSRLAFDYRSWCREQKTRPLRVSLLYASAYGNTATMARSLERGLLENDVAIDALNCEFADPAEIARSIEACDGFIIGSPTLAGHAPTQIQTALGIVLSTAAKTKLAGVFGSYGWSGEAVTSIETKLKDANFRLGFPSIETRFVPTEESLEQLREAGAEFARTLKKNRKARSPHRGVTDGTIDRTERALGRVVGSLCVLSDRSTAFLTSRVSQASFNPPGIALAIAEEQAAERLIHPGSSFVLNILKEGRNLRVHFSGAASRGGDPFAGLETMPAANGGTILSQGLAYLECTVKEHLRCGDRWLLYATVERGEVLDPSGLTAIDSAL